MRKGSKKAVIKPSKAGYILAGLLGAMLGIVFMMFTIKTYVTPSEADIRLYESLQKYK